jgi:hypothetical protein
MHGEAHSPTAERFLDLGDEEGVATDRREGAILDLITSGGDPL